MSTRKQILLEGNYEYDLEVVDNVYTLYHADVEYWHSHVRNTAALEMTNTGNGFTFKSLKKKNKLDYEEAFLMYVLLSVEKDYKVEIVEHTREL